MKVTFYGTVKKKIQIIQKNWSNLSVYAWISNIDKMYDKPL